jgi:hypothetical protein
VPWLKSQAGRGDRGGTKQTAASGDAVQNMSSELALGVLAVRVITHRSPLQSWLTSDSLISNRGELWRMASGVRTGNDEVRADSKDVTRADLLGQSDMSAYATSYAELPVERGRVLRSDRNWFVPR